MNEEDLRIWRLTHPYDRFLRNRLNTISNLFEQDPHSLDAVILAGTVLTALSFRRYRRRNNDQVNFESLLREYWTGYVDRVSLPSILRALHRRQPIDAELIARILQAFPSDSTYGRLRQVTDDPTASVWESWCADNLGPTDRVIADHSYARILFRDFRNSVQHRLEISDGHEGFPIGFDRPFFYTSGSRGNRLGFFHSDLGTIVTEVVAGLRKWALETDTDIFELNRV